MRIYSTVLLALLLSTTSAVQAMPAQDDCAGDDSQKPKPERPVFSKIDTNSDGDISAEEFSAQKIPHGEHQKIFASIDTDNNGVISSKEFEDHKPPHPKMKKRRGCNND